MGGRTEWEEGWSHCGLTDDAFRFILVLFAFLQAALLGLSLPAHTVPPKPC